MVSPSVVRVEMQSAIKSNDPTQPAKKTVLNTLKYIYRTNGIKGLYRGVTPRIGLGEFASSGRLMYHFS
jgi:hypothetical protein